EVLQTVSAPQKPGSYYLLVWANPEGSLNELLHTNNQSVAIPLTIGPRYTATAEVSGSFFSQGEPIPITGTATRPDGRSVANETVEISVTVDGVERRFETKTDAGGHYRYEFLPLANEAGRYSVSAGYPGTGNLPVQAVFDVLGVQVEN